MLVQTVLGAPQGAPFIFFLTANGIRSLRSLMKLINMANAMSPHTQRYAPGPCLSRRRPSRPHSADELLSSARRCMILRLWLDRHPDDVYLSCHTETHNTMATKKVPQRRNKKAGTSTGKSKSAKYFAKNPKARKKKNKYNTEYHSSTERKKYRAKLNKKTRAKSTPGKDVSHKKDGTTTREKRSTNRARNGKGGKSSKK